MMETTKRRTRVRIVRTVSTDHHRAIFDLVTTRGRHIAGRVADTSKSAECLQAVGALRRIAAAHNYDLVD